MSLFNNTERKFAETVSRLSFANPFRRERVDFEREVLGKDFDPNTRAYWSFSIDDKVDRPNITLITERVAKLMTKLREKIAAGVEVTEEEFQLYDDMALYVCYYRSIAYNVKIGTQAEATSKAWTEFSTSFDHWFDIEGKHAPSFDSKVHVFSYLCQLQRAFFNIFYFVVGHSAPISRLRARIWQSIFTHDMKRYRRSLFNKMQEVTTLVTGPSGTGKELVARAVGLSQYRPFDTKSKSFYGGDGEDHFFAINLSALSPTLIESELFGHIKGAFTGAAAARTGYLEAAGRYGCVFLDEIGEIDLAIQVKMLRVLQNREFQKIGDNTIQTFSGKIVAATNRDLVGAIETESFREDFYYRLCSDVIVTPSLAEQIEDEPDDIRFLINFLARRIAPEDADNLTQDVMTWFETKKPTGYSWPGNIRELDQCVRNIMIHNDYVPQNARVSKDPAERLAQKIRGIELTADEVVGIYCQVAYQHTKSYEKAAAMLKLDRRTVKAKIQAVEE